jgi:Glycosyl hydrolase family 59/Galactocerebrosidase, C-terminal lectin domain
MRRVILSFSAVRKRNWIEWPLAFLFLGVCIARCHPQAQLTTITLDGKDGGRIFEGVGVVSAGASSRLLIDYPEPYRSQILDYLFKPNYGASLQHLKVEIGADTNSTDGAEPSHMRSKSDLNFTRGYEWWLMKEAKKRNPAIKLDSLAWGAPGWIGNGNFWSQDMADYVAAWIRGAKEEYGLDIDFTGTWNEVWTGDPREHEWIKRLRKTLDAQGLKTQIVAPDPHANAGERRWNIIKTMQADPELGSAVYAVGVHYPFSNPEIAQPAWVRRSGYRLWDSEEQKGKNATATLNRSYIDGRMTTTEFWSPVTSYYDNLAAPDSGLMKANTPWSGHYEVLPAIWEVAHMTQFVQPGWQYLDKACGHLPAKGSFVSLRSPNLQDYSVIIETADAIAPQQLLFRISDGLSTGPVHVWRSDSHGMFVRETDLVPQQGSFSITVAPGASYSLTTTSGQVKGAATPPGDFAFPLPYRDNFEEMAIGRSRYLSDENGAFEVGACEGRSGRCLDQVIDRRPIAWAGITVEPYTYMGSARWRDYQVASDAMLEAPGWVTLLGRIDSADVFRNHTARWPSGYVLLVNEKGEWQLISASYSAPPRSLAQGNLSFGLHKWHNLSLMFTGTSIKAVMDSQVLATVTDKEHSTGMVGVGTGWNKAEFDNFSVQ